MVDMVLERCTLFMVLMVDIVFVVIIQHTKLLQSEMSLVKGGRHLVFVYGTLKRGEPNHHWLR